MEFKNNKHSMEQFTKRKYIQNTLIELAEFSDRNKFITHNSVAISSIVPIVWITDWTRSEIEEIDIKTRIILRAWGIFYQNTDPGKLYLTENQEVVETVVSKLILLKNRMTSLR